MNKTILILLLSAIYSCANSSVKQKPTDSTVHTTEDTLTNLEQQLPTLNTDSLGTFAKKISFEVRSKNLGDFPNGKAPWIRIDSPQIDMERLIDKDLVVIPE